MASALAVVPPHETTLVRLLRIAVIGMGQCFDRVFRRLELSEHAFHVLCLLMASESGAASPSDLSELVGATRTHMTRIVDELAGHGFINREADQRDGRRAICSITPKGRAAAQQAAEKLAGPLAKAFSGLNPREMGQLDALLRKAIQSFDRSAYASAGDDAPGKQAQRRRPRTEPATSPAARSHPSTHRNRR